MKAREVTPGAFTTPNTIWKQNMERNTTPLTALAMVAVILTATLGVAFATAPVSAQTDGEDEDSVVDALFFDEGEDGDGFEAVYAAAMGVLDKYNPLAERPEKANAEQYATNVQSTFNQNSSVLMNWTNERVTGSEDADVVRLKFTDESGGTKYLFVVSDVNSTTGNYTNARVMNVSEFDDSGRDHDLTYRLSPYASRNANAELETFISDYAEPNNNVTKSYLAHLAGEYRGEVEGSDLPGDD